MASSAVASFVASFVAFVLSASSSEVADLADLADVEIKEGLVFEPGARLALDLFPAPDDARPSPVVLVAGAPIDASTPGRRDPKLRALCAELAANGATAALCDWRSGVEIGRRDLRAASQWLRAHADDEGLAADRLALHGSGAGAQPMLELAMEDGIGSALSLHGIGVVIEGLRPDLPILAVVDPADPPRARAGVRELAHQLELCAAPFTRVDLASDLAIARIARFHLERLEPPPSDPAAIADAGAAFDVARLHAERGDEDAFFRWLARARELGFDDPSRVLHDQALVKLRAQPRFRRWIADHAARSREALCRESEPGRRITIRARVLEPDRQTPARNALVYLWQTDRTGLYAYDDGGDARSRLYAYVRTDEDGRFAIDTIEPGGYPRTMIPAHIHIAVQTAGRPEQSLEFVFDDDPRMVDSARERAAQLGWPIVELSGPVDGPASGDAVIGSGDAVIVLR